MMQTTIFASPESLELANKGWLTWARSQAKTISLTAGSVTSDDVREKANESGLQPDSKFAWGGLFATPGFVCIGRKRSVVKSNNGRHISIWKWVGI